MTKFGFRNQVSACALAILSVMSSVAHAEDVAAGADAAGQGGDEIIVTGRAGNQVQ